MTDNRLLSVRIGKIIQSDPILNMYYILANGGRIKDDGTVEGEIIPATVLGSTTLNLQTVTDRVAYPVGTSVLFAHEADSVNSNGIEIAVILGALVGNINSSYEPCVKLNAPEYGIDFYNANFHHIHRIQYQNVTPLHDFSGNGPTDIWYGEWSKQGNETLLLLGNDRFLLNAGACSISIDSVSRRLVVDSGLLSQKTFVNAIDTKLVNNNTVFTDKISGTAYSARTAALSKNSKKVGDDDPDDGIEKFRYIRQVSDVTGVDGYFVLDDAGNPIAHTSMRFDGEMAFKSAKGISIEHTLDMKHYSYKGRIVDVEDSLEELNWHDLIHSDSQVLDDFLTNWGIATLHEAAAKEQQYLEPVEEEGEASTEETRIVKTKISINEVTRDYEFVDNTSGFYITPTGTIIIRDAWGSEIRMTNGNIQFAAANTLSLLSGRDTIMMQGGVLSANAVKGIDLGGADGSILLKGTNVKMVAGDKETPGIVSMEAPSGEIIIASDRKASISATDVDIVSASITNPAAQGSVNILSKGNLVLGSDRNLVLSAKYSASIATNYAHLDLGSSITLNCVGGRTVIGGALYVEPVSSQAPVVSIKNQKIETQKYQTTMARIETSGDVIVTGMSGIMANGIIATAGTVFGKTIVAHNLSNKGVYKSKKAPPRVNASYKAQSYNDDKGFGERLFDYLKSIYNKEIFSKLFSFNKKAKGCVVYEPPYSEKYANKVQINPVTHMDNDGKVSYIYPGDSFWRADGLCQADMSVNADLETMLSCNYIGAAKLNVLPSSVVEKEN